MTEMELCIEKHKHIDETLALHNERLNSQSAKIDALERDFMGALKDIAYLKDAITQLKISIDKLIDGLDSLRVKPLAKYEQIVMFVITFVIAYVLGKAL